MIAFAEVLGYTAGIAGVIFIETLIINVLVKYVLITLTTLEERKKAIKQNFSAIKMSLIFTAIAVALLWLGVSAYKIGYYFLYTVPFIIVVDLLIAYKKNLTQIGGKSWPQLLAK